MNEIFKKGLTIKAIKRMKRIYSFIISYKRSHGGNSPTLREISESLKEELGVCLSSSMMSAYIKELGKMGLLNPETLEVRRTRLVYYGSLLEDFSVINHHYRGRVMSRKIEAMILDLLDEDETQPAAPDSSHV